MANSRNIDSWMRRSALRGLSIQQRLPLLICVLLLVMMITFSLISYIGVRRTALKSGSERLNSLSDQLSLVMSQSAQTFTNSTRTSAHQPGIHNCLTSLNPVTCTEAINVLDKIREDSMTILVKLLDKNYRQIIRSGKEGFESLVNFDSLMNLSKTRDTASFGRFYRIRDSLYYPIIIRIADQQQVLGYLVRWRLVTVNPRSIQQFAQLMGSNAALYIGNEDESAWSNMIGPIANPIPANARLRDNVYSYMHGNGNPVIAAKRPIKNTHWIVLIEFPQKAVLAPARRFLQWIIIIASALIAVGSFIAWIMSRNITKPLNELTHALSEITSGKETHAISVERRDEVGKLSRAFNAMTVQVRNAKQALEKKVIESEHMNEQLRNLSAHLQNIREQERIHIAREMHDELGQLLTGFKMDVSWLNRKFASNEDPALKEKLEEMETIVDEAVSFVRKIAAELRPSILDDLGLIPALEWHSKEFQKRFNIEVDFHPKIQDLETSELIATGLFRMYQESLTNVARHSGAKKVVATLETTSNDISLSIADNGKGFDMSANGERKTLGLLGMKERAVMIGGKLEIDSKPGRGTTVNIRVPKNQKIGLSN